MTEINQTSMTLSITKIIGSNIHCSMLDSDTCLVSKVRVLSKHNDPLELTRGLSGWGHSVYDHEGSPFVVTMGTIIQIDDLFYEIEDVKIRRNGNHLGYLKETTNVYDYKK